MITYKEQFDKLTRAYIENKIKRLDPCCCFVGNLLNNTYEWKVGSEKCVFENSGGFYTLDEMLSLESVFMKSFWDKKVWHMDTEDRLFISFEKALEYLKQIHISKGEVIDETPVFKKRELQKI